MLGYFRDLLTLNNLKTPNLAETDSNQQSVALPSSTKLIVSLT